MTAQVIILRAVKSFAPNFARLKNATTAFFNRLLKGLRIANYYDLRRHYSRARR